MAAVQHPSRLTIATLAWTLLATAGGALAQPRPAGPESAAAAATPASVYLEQLTWTEVRDAVRAGSTTAILPVGGTEQSGPHIALGKHNARAQLLAGKIATQLGHTLVAPVLAYAPEGVVQPPQGHMRYAGTLSVPEDAFKSLLMGAARSLKAHGFTDVVLLGDHGGYQQALQNVADRLNKEWAGSGARAHHVAAYYQAADAGFAAELKAKGYTAAQIGSHAGLADTSLTLALAPALVRPLPTGPLDKAASGVAGDPRGATAALGHPGVDMIVARTVAALKTALKR